MAELVRETLVRAIVKQWLVDMIAFSPQWLWNLLPRRVKLWAFMNDGGCRGRI